jgi:hypothetical protein
MTAMQTLFDLYPEAAPIPHPDQLTVFDAIAEVEAEQADTIPECTAGCCSPACHAALFRPCCGACMSDAAKARRDTEINPPADVLTVIREHFDAIWNGTAGGFSREKLQEGLAESEQMLEDLEAGRITPRRVIGNGYKKPKTVAREYLHRVIAQGRRDLATEGRTDCTNIANVRFRLCEQYGWDSVPAKHRVSVTTDRVNISNTLWKLSCTCEDSECGYSRVYPDHTARKIEAHMAGERTLR